MRKVAGVVVSAGLRRRGRVAGKTNVGGGLRGGVRRRPLIRGGGCRLDSRRGSGVLSKGGGTVWWVRLQEVPEIGKMAGAGRAVRAIFSDVSAPTRASEE